MKRVLLLIAFVLVANVVFAQMMAGETVDRTLVKEGDKFYKKHELKVYDYKNADDWIVIKEEKIEIDQATVQAELDALKAQKTAIEAKIKDLEDLLK